MNAWTPDIAPLAGTTALVTDGGRGSSRSAVACVRALGMVGVRSLVTVARGGEELAAASRWARPVVVPSPADPNAYREAVEAIGRDCVAVFATSDMALTILDMPGAALVDKELLAQRAAVVGMPMPVGHVFEDRADLAHADLAYPVVVKVALGAIPAVRVAGPCDLDRIPDHAGRLVVQPYLVDEMAAVSGVMWDGRLLAAVHQRYVRRWPVDCGTASAAVTVEPDEELESQLVRLLDGHRGIFQAQLIGPNLIDVNPRPYGSMPLATQSGANLPQIVCCLAAGVWSADHPMVRAQPGVRYRWIEGDVRHVVRRLGDGSLSPMGAIRAIAPRRHVAHSVMSLRDPGPALLRGRQIARQVLGRGRR